MSECRSQICNPSSDPTKWIDPRVTPEIRAELQKLILDNDTLKKVSDLFRDNIERGLKKDTNPDAAVKCYPTYVQDLPDGTENGKFFALDLGGSNFRVLLVELDGDKCDMKSEIYSISQEIMTGTGQQLFDHIADCLWNFANAQGILGEHLPLGLTWSFPLEQKGLSSGILVKWTKGFNCSDVVGQDVVELLRQAIERRGDMDIDVCAVLNDTTGTLMSCAFKNRQARIGLILGTGNNGCYVEKQANAELFDEPDMGSGNVIINLEMGGFGDDGCLDFIRTDVDHDVETKCSVNPGWTNEKMISGMYLGEIVRLYMLKFIEQGLMFGGQGADNLKEIESFPTKRITEVEQDAPSTFNNAKQILEEIGLKDATEQDYINLRFICECVSRRSAHLAATALVTLMHKMDEKKVVVGVDGSVYKYHPHIRRWMMQKIKELVDPSISFDLMLSEDGSGIGAAVVAAVAARKKAESA